MTSHQVKSLVFVGAVLVFGLSGCGNDQAPVCGNDIIEEGETCDGDCPNSCDDQDPCTTDSLTGSAADCDVVCVNEIITACIDDDGCCPGACDVDFDNDCVDSCHNVVGGGVTVVDIAEQTGMFEIVWDVTPASADVDAVVALTHGAPSGQDWSLLAATVMFSRNSVIEGFNGDSYEGDVVVPYLPGQTYRLRLVIDVPSHQYSIYAAAPGGQEQLIAQDYAFRNGQESVASLDHMVLMSGAGELRACLLSLQAINPSVEVVVSPSSVTLEPEDSQQFTATVSNANVTTVTWSVEESECGVITADGMYTAPSSEKTCHVRAISVEDNSASGQATVSVAGSNAPPDPLPTGTSYYFAEDGHDEEGTGPNQGDGSKAHPYKSLDKMNALIPSLNPGDAILFAMGDTFEYLSGSANEIMNVDGTEDEPIIFGRYWKDGDAGNTSRPVLTGKTEKRDYSWTETSQGSGVWESNTAPGSKTRMLKNGVEQVQCEDMGEFNDNPEVELFHDRERNKLVHRSAEDPTGSVWTYAVQQNIFAFTFSEHIIFNGLEINWCSMWGTPLDCVDSHHITIQNCKIGEFSHNAVSLNGNYSVGRGEGFVVQNNTFDTGWRRDYSFDYIRSSDGVMLHNLLNLGSYADHSLVQHNRFIDFGHCAIYLANTSDTVGGRWIHNYFSAPNSAYARPFDSTGSVHSGLEIAYNVVEHCCTQTQIKGTETHWHHNIFRDWTLNNQHHINYDLLDSKCSPISSVGENSIIENNVFYNIASVPIKFTSGNNATTIRNNIFHNCSYDLTEAGNHGAYDSRGISIAFVPWADPGADRIANINCLIENNLFYDDELGSDFVCVMTGRRSGDLGTGDVYHTFSADTLDTANYPNWPRNDNIEGNPEFIDTIDFRISSSSPANDSGTQPASNHDYAGDEIHAPFNIGLYNSEN